MKRIFYGLGAALLVAVMAMAVFVLTDSRDPNPPKNHPTATTIWCSAASPEGSLDDATELSDQTLTAYTNPEFAPYCSATFKSKLNANEQRVYTAMEYAIYEERRFLYFPRETYGGVDLDKVFDAVMADNPFVECNLQQAVWSGYHPEGPIDVPQYTVIELMPGSLDKKREALARAQEIVGGIPYSDDLDRAWYLYHYLTGRVSYETGANASDYLYDALVLERSNCDGISKALALLFHVAGIDCNSLFYHDLESRVLNLLVRLEVDVGIAFDETLRLKEPYADLEQQEVFELLAAELLASHGINLKAMRFYDEESGQWSVAGHAFNAALVKGDYRLFDATNDLQSTPDFPQYFGLSNDMLPLYIQPTLRALAPPCVALEPYNCAYIVVADITSPDERSKILANFMKNLGDPEPKAFVNIIAKTPFDEEALSEFGQWLQEQASQGGLHCTYSANMTRLQVRVADAA